MKSRAHYYSVLGLAQNASLASIKTAYRNLAKLYHPDVSKDPNAEDRFVEINEAYEHLLKAPRAQTIKNKRTSAYYTRKEREYKEWVKLNEEFIKSRAHQKAHMTYSDWIEEEGFGSATEFAFVKLFGCLFSIFVFGLLLFFIYQVLDLFGLAETIGLGIAVTVIFLFLPGAVLIMSWLEEKRIYHKIKKRLKSQFGK